MIDLHFKSTFVAFSTLLVQKEKEDDYTYIYIYCEELLYQAIVLCHR